MNKVPENQSTVSFHVTNCDAKTANFISGIIALFCDPQSEPRVAQVATGNVGFRMDPKSGAPIVCQLKPLIAFSEAQRN